MGNNQDNNNNEERTLEEIIGVTGMMQPYESERRKSGSATGPRPLTGKPFSGEGSSNYQQKSLAGGIKMEFCHSMAGWQSEILYRLNQGRDVYVATRPGSGKTMPIICYWGETILKLNPRRHSGGSEQDDILSERAIQLLTNPEQFGKIVYFCPVRSLVDDVSKGFREVLSHILTQVFNYLLTNLPNPKSERLIQILLQSRALKLDGRYINDKLNQLKAIAKDINNLKNRPDVRGNREIQNRLKELMTQQTKIYQDLEGKLGQALKAKMSKLVSTRSGIHKEGNPSEALVTVSVTESASSTFSEIRNTKSISLVVFDESHLLQATESDGVDQAKEKMKGLYLALNNLSNNRNTKFALMSGTVHPEAADDLIEYMKKCFGRKFNKIMASEAKNKAQIDVTANDKITEESFQIKLLTNPSVSNNVLIIFSQKRILDLARKAIKSSGASESLGGAERGNVSRSPHQYSDLTRKPEFKTGISPSNIESQVNAPKGAEEIYEDLQRQAVALGFGFIIRPDNRQGVEPDKVKDYYRDQQIVAELFRKGKINTIMATHSIGVGVNVYVKRMYIPSIESPGSGGFQKMGTAVASQLYNRVGRAAFPIGSVITTSEYRDDVIKALSAGQEEFERGINVNIGNLDCRAYTFTSLFLNTLDKTGEIVSKLDKAWRTGG